MTISQRSVWISLAGLLFLSAAGTASAQIATTVFIPGNTLGDFGNPSEEGNQPYVTGIVATGPGTIVVIYLSGTVTDGPTVNTGPTGAPWNMASGQTPLQEAFGVAGGTVQNLDALIGTFVPRWRTLAEGFTAIDGTKDITPVGLLPSGLFFIGTKITFYVPLAGTLFLGINDNNGVTNGGGYNVSVTFTPPP